MNVFQYFEMDSGCVLTLCNELHIIQVCIICNLIRFLGEVNQGMGLRAINCAPTYYNSLQCELIARKQVEARGCAAILSIARVGGRRAQGILNRFSER